MPQCMYSYKRSTFSKSPSYVTGSLRLTALTYIRPFTGEAAFVTLLPLDVVGFGFSYPSRHVFHAHLCKFPFLYYCGTGVYILVQRTLLLVLAKYCSIRGN
jgi:hypothetical protein